jgi:two-component system alkaline phosphatase synthesis response regulator PhoP
MSNVLLIIEDDPYVQRFYQRLFRFHDYAVEIAGNGTEGFTKAKALKPALILLDIVMPGANGIQVLGQLKNDPDTKNVPVVIQKAVALGAIDFIIKSSAPEEQLLAIVDKYFKQAEEKPVAKGDSIS